VRTDGTRVDIALKGNPEKVQEIIDGLASGKHLNSWGARCDSVNTVPSGLALLEHEVNTANVDDIQWVQGVTFYL
jgi:hypothetical protein